MTDEELELLNLLIEDPLAQSESYTTLMRKLFSITDINVLGELSDTCRELGLTALQSHILTYVDRLS